MLIRLIEFATPEYDLSVRLRDEILRKPLGLSFKVEDFEKEYLDIHMGVFNESNDLLACLIFTQKSKTIYKMRQVAVKKEVQGQGIGTKLVAFAENYAKSCGIEQIVLNARDVSIAFYEKMSYEKVGDAFTEVGILHYKMTKDI